MIDNTALLRARVKMFKAKKVATSLEKSKPSLSSSFEDGERTKAASAAFRQYSGQAREILRDISELRDLVLDKRKEYILCSGSMVAYSFTTIMSETDRRRFDADSDTAVKQCLKLVDFFGTQIKSDRTLRQSDELPHLKIVFHLLTVYLKEVCGLIEQLRAIYRKKSEHLRKICRLANLVEKYERSIEDARRVDRALHDEKHRREREIGGASASDEEKENGGALAGDDSAKIRRRRPPDVVENVDDDPPPVIEELSRNEQEQLVLENRKFFDKVAHSDEDILHIGRQLSEIQRLQNTFAEKVTEQEHDIDHIHTQTVYTLDNLDAANQFIRDAIKNTASRRVITLFCLIVLTFTLLFLDWYNP